ncbi:TetR family transcriptional regulator [Ignatzschineria ureiclastica]|uniref:TetR family transcriptional regulator n=1 Tax=Ignatzschineria ureiclastica TaxID=472582 RepID=A0A2U2ACY3_9GAMM|nr:TetR family transcriptional regulator [Ignatzschineria ureiclastica]PWD80518.1 TetR family transcriptional regulator [Ignatzschineria ureiclastica]GGZ98862.1 TetR family transcriptional regulator [Ignatzschineria ureiclastica]
MAYLTKQERYEEILHLATMIAREEGLSAITARNIATKGQIAVGQVHHHFQSISQLKAMALETISKALLKQNDVMLKEMTLLDQLIQLLCPYEEGDIGNTMRRLWSESQFLAEQDAEIKKAYKQSIDDWYQQILQLVKEGVQQGCFHIQSASETTWMLIAVSCGFDSLSVVEDFRVNRQLIRRHIAQILQVDGKAT